MFLFISHKLYSQVLIFHYFTLSFCPPDSLFSCLSFCLHISSYLYSYSSVYLCTFLSVHHALPLTKMNHTIQLWKRPPRKFPEVLFELVCTQGLPWLVPLKSPGGESVGHSGGVTVYGNVHLCCTCDPVIGSNGVFVFICFCWIWSRNLPPVLYLCPSRLCLYLFYLWIFVCRSNYFSIFLTRKKGENMYWRVCECILVCL